MNDELPNPELVKMRVPYGWIAFWLLTIFLVVVMLIPYLNSGKKGANVHFAQRSALKSAVNMKRTMQVAFTILGRKGDDQKDLNAWLEDPLSELAPVRQKNQEAAVLYTVMRHEKGNPPDVTLLEYIGSSKSKANQAIAQIYGSSELSDSEARALIKDLPDAPFEYKLASVHALEKAMAKNPRDLIISTNKAIAAVFTMAAAMAAFTLGAFLLMTYGMMRLTGKLIPLGHPSGTLTALGADIYTLRATQFLVIIFFVQAIVGKLATLILPSKPAILVTEALLLTLTVLVMTTPIYGKKIKFEHIGLHTRDLGKNIAWGIGGWLASLPVLSCMALLGNALFRGLPDAVHPVSIELQNNPSTFTIFTIFLAAAVMAPILEEICFRGHLAPAMSTLFGRVSFGIIASSIVFAAIHPTGIPAWFALATIGGFSALLAYQTKSLVPSLVLHAIHNTATLLMALTLF